MRIKDDAVKDCLRLRQSVTIVVFMHMSVLLYSVCVWRKAQLFCDCRVLPEPPMVGGCETEGSSEVEALQMTPVELFRPRGPSILKKTISPDVKLKSGRVLTWNKPLIELREYEMR